MNIIIERFNKIKSNIAQNVEIVAISKTFPIDHIKPLIDYGHRHFGENKVQEAEAKWKSIKSEIKDLNLHMVGKLQTNKVKQAVKIFDYIHSLDSIKLAKKISEEQIKINRNLKIFIQINIGEEKQKSGIDIHNLKSFYDTCTKDFNLEIIGLMCLPPADKDPSKYFEKMQKMSKDLLLPELSMGMSADYPIALKYNASFIRIGSKIFGARN